MPRTREYRSPSYDRDEPRERNRKQRERSKTSHENEKKDRKHKTRDRSRCASSDDEPRSKEERMRRHKDSSRHRERRNRNEQETEFDPHKRIKQECVDNTEMLNQRRDRRQNDERRKRSHQQRQAEGDDTNFGQTNQNETPVDKEKPDFKLSGKLTEDTNTFRGVVVNYNEPPEARKPKKKWRLYPFKGETELPVLHIHRQSAYLVGRDRRVADIPVDHPSCSKQHAALQFRLVEFKREDSSRGRKVKPYVIDLNSANGTYVNNQKIDSQRYVELFEKDVVKFGYSSREYVILHDKVDTSELLDEEDDD